MTGHIYPNFMARKTQPPPRAEVEKSDSGYEPAVSPCE
jgi:hypothetical protein